MRNRIIDLFRDRKKEILSVYYTAGYPSLEDTVPVALALEREGADLIEIGIPFSDPVADGPTIQKSNKVALDNGMNLRLLIEQVARIRSQCSLPVILMGYLNPVLQYGMERFVADSAAAGVDGVILPDMPLLEYEQQYAGIFRSAGLCNTFLVSPTTSAERIRRIDAATDGFVYAVSASSTTGARKDFSKAQLDYFGRLREMKLKNPFLIGFGISDRATFATACTYAAGGIVGSAFITTLAGSRDIEKDIAIFVKDIKG